MDPLSPSETSKFAESTVFESLIPKVEGMYAEVVIKVEELSPSSGVCRLCLRNVGEQDIFSADVLAKLQLCCSIHLHQNDGLPHHICAECAHTLDVCHSFRTSCELNDAILHEQLQEIKQSSIHQKTQNTNSLLSLLDYDKVKIETFFDSDNENVSTLNGEVKIKEVNKKNNKKGSNTSKNTFTKRKKDAENKDDLVVCNDESDGTDSDYFGDKQIAEASKTKSGKSKVGDGTADLCVICGETYSSYREHQTWHKAQTSVRKCATCDMEFKHDYKYKRHILCHSEVRTFPCEVCGMLFKHSDAVTRHNNHVHKKKYAVKCIVCGKTTTNLQGLKAHLLTHSSERNFECDYCHKMFQYKYTLRSHIKTHTGERPYSCYVCGKMFSLKGSLREHVRLHTGERPFKCPICDLGFAQRGNMKSHFRHNHKGIPFAYNIKKT